MHDGSRESSRGVGKWGEIAMAARSASTSRGEELTLSRETAELFLFSLSIPENIPFFFFSDLGCNGIGETWTWGLILCMLFGKGRVCKLTIDYIASELFILRIYQLYP